MRCIGSFLLFCSFTATAQDVVGNWQLDKHLMILNNDGTFFASGYEPIDDQYGTYRLEKNKIYFTYNMYNGLVNASYGFTIDEDGSLLLYDELGYTLEYVRVEQPNY